jgi:glycosyltransferase involved in cell wall biosynthesis
VDCEAYSRDVEGDAVTGGTAVSVVVCTHTDRRLALLLECVQSLLRNRPHQIVVVVDSNEPLRERLAGLLPEGVPVIASDGRGVSAARNTGVAAATGDVIAFIDDDALAEPDWLRHLTAPLADGSVVATGGRIVPMWERPGPNRLPAELYWVVGCTYTGHPVKAQPITRPIACNMAARRDALVDTGGFPIEFGPSGPKPKNHSNEEIALAVTLRRRYGRDSIRYAPDAVVNHFVPTTRTTWRYLWQRCVAEGVSKADVRLRYGREALGFDHSYARRTLVPAIVRYTAGGLLRRDRLAATRAVAAAGGLLVTAAAFGGRLVTAGGRRAARPTDHRGRTRQRV